MISANVVKNILEFNSLTQKAFLQKDFLAVRFRGKGFEPRIFDGDIIILKIERTFQNGDMIFCFDSGAPKLLRYDHLSNLRPLARVIECRYSF